jgi:hypothetical protein
MSIKTDTDLIKAFINYSDGYLLYHLQEMHKNTKSKYYRIDEKSIANMNLFDLNFMTDEIIEELKRELNFLLMINSIKKVNIDTSDYYSGDPKLEKDIKCLDLPVNKIAVIDEDDSEDTTYSSIMISELETDEED